jgi:hypothetical protein
VFEDMAFGRFPSPTFFQKDYLCCAIKGKEFVYRVFDNQSNLIPASAEQLYHDIRDLLSRRVGLLSEKEAIHQRNVVLNHQQVDFEKERFSEESWNVVRKKMIKDNVIEQFVLHMKEMYRLGPAVVHYFFSLLIIGFLFKTIQAKDIQYEHGKIKSILDIHFKPCRIQWNRHVYLNDLSPLHCFRVIPPPPVLKTISLSDIYVEETPMVSTPLSSYWAKYLTNNAVSS